MVRNILIVVLIGACVMLTMSGCSKKEEPETQAVQTLRFGYFPIANLTPIYVAKEKGYFKEVGINLEMKKMMGSPLIASAIAGGDVDFGSMSFITLTLSRQKKLPIRMVASFGYSTPGRENQGLAVLKDSPIKRIEDLEGKAIGGSMKATEPWFWVMDLLKKRGVKNYNYLELNTPNIAPALEAGTIDAAQLSEPWLTVMKDKIRIIHIFGNVTGGCGYCFSEKILKEKPDVIINWVKAMAKAVRFINENESEARKIMAKYTGTPEDIAMKSILLSWDEKSRLLVDASEEELDWMIEYKMIDKKPALDDLWNDSFTGRTIIKDLVKGK